MYFQINGLSDTQSAGLSTMFQLACAIGNVLGGTNFGRDGPRGMAASHIVIFWDPKSHVSRFSIVVITCVVLECDYGYHYPGNFYFLQGYHYFWNVLEPPDLHRFIGRHVQQTSSKTTGN